MAKSMLSDGSRSANRRFGRETGRLSRHRKEDLWSQHKPLEEDYAWQLFNIADDPSEIHDLAADDSDKLSELIVLWGDTSVITVSSFRTMSPAIDLKIYWIAGSQLPWPLVAAIGHEPL